jgi:hypothetical protein
MNPPLGTGRTGLFDERPIHQAQVVLRGDGGLYTALFKQGAAQLIKPFPALAQPFKQGDRGEFRQFSLVGARHGLAHGQPATKVQHQHPQVALLTLILSQPLERTTRFGQVPPVGRKKGREQFPILIGRVMDYRVLDLHPRIIAAAAQISQHNKLTLMGRCPGLV